MEPWIWIALAAATIAVLVVPIPKSLRNRTTERRYRKYPTSGAILGAINEVFNPSAHNAAVILEQKQEAGRENPSPEDKHKP